MAEEASRARARAVREARGMRPVLLEGAARETVAVRTWSDARAFRVAGAGARTTVLTSRAEGGKTFIKRDCDVHDDGTFEEACERIFDRCERAYARAVCTETMAAESGVDVAADAFGRAANLLNCGVWFGAASSVTPLHYDLCHGFLIQIKGVKTFDVFHPDDFRAMYPRKDRPELSRVDVAKYLAGDAREREQFPDFGDVEPVGAYTLRPGDVLYTPPFFWHHVRTHDEETAISVLVPFDMSPAEPIHVCHLY